MSRPSASALSAKRKELRDAIAELGSEIAAAKRARRNAERVAADAWALTEHMRRVVLAAFVLAEYMPEPAVKYLVARGRERHWPERSEEDLSTFVENIFLASMEGNAEEAIALADLSEPTDQAALRDAVKYVHEWRVVIWVRDASSTAGEAPSTRSELEHAEVMRAELPESVQPSPWGTAADVRGRKWAQRLRARWGGRHAAVPAPAPLQPAAFQSKAALAQGHRCGTGASSVSERSRPSFCGQVTPFLTLFLGSPGDSDFGVTRRLRYLK